MTKVMNMLILSFVFAAFAGNINAQNQDKQKLYMEYMQIQMKLQQLQNKAFEDVELARMRDEFTYMVDSEMRKISPEAAKLVDEKIAKMDAFLSAQKAGDKAKMQTASKDAQAAIKSLSKYQKQVMHNKIIGEKEQLLQTAMMKKFAELDPNFGKLFTRMQEIQSLLQGGK